MHIKILLLEDDALFGETLIDLLEEENYTVSHARNGQEALDFTYSNKFDLYLLDINVPLINGLEILKELRQSGDDTPAIYLTSHQDKETLAQAFSNGADDYLKKPFDSDELLMRVAARLRHITSTTIETVGTYCIDEVHHTISIDNAELNLTMKEYSLLLLLIRNFQKTVTKEMIFTSIWAVSEEVSEGAIRVYIKRLKDLIGEDSIENIRGVGYRLVS